MRRPINPTSQGSEPKRVHSQKDGVTLTRDDKLSLETIVGAWTRIVKDHLAQGHRISEGPNVEGGNYGGIRLTYTFEWDNLNYSVEKAEWDAAIATYEQELVAWNQFEENRKKKITDVKSKDLDAQIERAEHRLANLKAAKAGETLPYPEG